MTDTAKFKFEKLRVWQEAMRFGEDIDQLSETFPEKERYNLTSQISRAADSVALNISEGSIIQSTSEFRKFLGYAARSLAEVVTCLHKSKLRNYLQMDKFEVLYNDAFKLMNMIIAFRNSL